MSSSNQNTRIKILEATWHLMEQRRGQGVRMSDIAKAAGLSRQAVYLHFENRTDLIRETRDYIDEINGFDSKLDVVRAARSGREMLNSYVDLWGGYLPDIQGVAGALLAASETDDAASAAWDDCMIAHRQGCKHIIESLSEEGVLVPDWPATVATEMLWTILSFQTWEQLTVGSGWSREDYCKWIKLLAARTFIVGA